MPPPQTEKRGISTRRAAAIAGGSVLVAGLASAALLRRADAAIDKRAKAGWLVNLRWAFNYPQAALALVRGR